MSKPTIRIHDLAKDEVIDREMTDAEFAKAKADQAAQAELKAQADAKETAKAALLTRLGITAEEAQLLLS
jgi:hypothetical protein